MRVTRTFKLIATVFPGLYKFVLVNLVALLAVAEVSQFFSKAFFEIGLLVAFAGVAVSSQAYAKGDGLSFLSNTLMILIILSFGSLGLWVFYEGAIEGFILIVASALFLSMFEVLRAQLAACGEFMRLTVSAFLSFLFLVPLVVYLNDEKYLMVFFTFLSLFVSVIIVDRRSFSFSRKVDAEAFKNILSYSASSGLSTGLTFFIPLILIREFGEGSSILIAQVFTLSSLFFFYPRYLSAGFMVELRREKVDGSLITIFRRRLFRYTLFVSFLFFVFAFFESQYMDFVLLFVAMQVGQLNLPYANVHMVMARGYDLLLVNCKALIFISVLLVGAYLMLDEGATRGKVILGSFLLYMFVRFVLTKYSYEREDCHVAL